MIERPSHLISSHMSTPIVLRTRERGRVVSLLERGNKGGRMVPFAS
jgi:hypothetical protein